MSIDDQVNESRIHIEPNTALDNTGELPAVNIPAEDIEDIEQEDESWKEPAMNGEPFDTDAFGEFDNIDDFFCNNKANQTPAFEAFYRDLEGVGVDTPFKSASKYGQPDLNDLQAEDDGRPDATKIDRSDIRTNARVHIFFKSIESKIMQYLEKSEIIVGCVAWLTNERLLAALAGKRASIIVQKEDFLRPDGPDSTRFRSKLQSAYGKIHGMARYDFPLSFTPAGGLSISSGDHMDPIRCCGMFDKSKRFIPRMHHKFVVLYKDDVSFPACVITGSWNWSDSASRSLENAICIYDRDAAQAYVREWAHVLSLSEPLDWTSEYVAPDMRFGT